MGCENVNFRFKAHEYVAGFDSISSTLSYTLYELARNAEVQRKIQENIDVSLRKYNGELTYESMMDMKYVEICVMGIQ